MTAPVLRSITVPVSPAEAFVAFTDRIGAWWPLPTHGVHGDRAGGLAFEEGRLVERAVDGTAAVWGEVLVWDAPHRIVVTWHPGREVGESSEVEVRFVLDGDATRVEVEHRGWETFGEDALRRRRGYAGPSAWGAVLDHFADVVEERPGGADLSALADAYAELFAEADRGGFGPPPEGEWGAAQVLAHVTLSDLAMTAVAQGILHGREVRFENEVCQDPAVLAAHIARFDGDLGALADHGREMAEVAMTALARLDADQRAALVPCLLRHDGEVVLDRAMPWGVVADETQAARHLPAHVGQLRDLRRPAAQTLS